MSAPESAPPTPAVRPAHYSPRLYNADLAPRGSSAPWRTWDLFCWWMSAWHSLGSYTFAIGLLVLGLTGWQVVAAVFGGLLVLLVGCNLMGVAGQRAGVPFPVFARLSFGVHGANVPALLRAVVAVAWYGIQTYLASLAVVTLALKLFPGAAGLAEAQFLGMSGLGWICFGVLWVVQLAVLNRGMEAVRKLSDVAGPVLWIAIAALALWVLGRAGWSIDWNYRQGPALDGPHTVGAIVSGAFLTVAFLSGPMLNFADFSRNSPDARSIRRGNSLGLLVNGTAFALVSVVIALASAKLHGVAVTDPVELVKDIDSVTLLLVATVAIAGSAVGINIILNFVSPAYDFANTAPSRISFRTGGTITAVVSLLVMPWKLYSSPVAVNYFIGGVGALIGPLFGIMVVDYYLVRRGHVDVDALYSADPAGRYHYRRGVNPNAVGALVAAGALTLLVAFWPALSGLAAYSWLVGCIAGGALYLLIEKVHPQNREETP
ncbi:NCS1 family nucleobase:cation symporter-1 [Kineococcus rhizosphaerae]|uniref:NCS1 family nucleobase:cation symporter-1 n=1 Tax=Kineococcus rhizosphaerae TaxID=559628 RepID=A0A2T0R700_9ACTN|nr:NCS1 family nucleobase:cation symporter-1 [Kineococcus rhizosphaerae]PRY16946.1 NCS1 family nucleobase:cation symporter-1 [Kineococcus rhizosphaerae]